ncbi:unnamed protein product [Calypogeia fissa]
MVPNSDKKQSTHAATFKENISTSIFGAQSCGNKQHSLNSVTASTGHQQLQPLGPVYLKAGRTGWMRLREYIEGTPANDSENLCPSPELRSMTSDAANNYMYHVTLRSMTSDAANNYMYHVTEDGGLNSVVTTEIWKLLLTLGADPQYSSVELASAISHSSRRITTVTGGWQKRLICLSSRRTWHPVLSSISKPQLMVSWSGDKSSPWAAEMLRNLMEAMMSQGAHWYYSKDHNCFFLEESDFFRVFSNLVSHPILVSPNRSCLFLTAKSSPQRTRSGISSKT